jgi:hypothetical protein
LLGEDPLGEVDVESVEIDRLAGGVDLRLVRRLALSEHRRTVDDGAVPSGQQLGRSQEHRRPGGLGHA